MGRGEEEQSLGEGEEREAEERAEDSLMTFSSTLPYNKLTGGSEGQGRYRREWTMAGDFPPQLPENIAPFPPFALAPALSV